MPLAVGTAIVPLAPAARVSTFQKHGEINREIALVIMIVVAGLILVPLLVELTVASMVGQINRFSLRGVLAVAEIVPASLMTALAPPAPSSAPKKPGGNDVSNVPLLVIERGDLPEIDTYKSRGRQSLQYARHHSADA